MQRHSKNGLEWLTFELLDEHPQLKHGLLLRAGGHSQGNFASLNVALNGQDDPARVRQNLQKITSTLNLPPLHLSKQVHGKAIWEIDHNQSGPEMADAMLTCVPNQTLMIAHADCQAAIFYDPIQKIVANVHAGWRGQVQGIYQEVLTYLKDKYQVKTENVLVGISASLGPKHAEFKHYQTEFPQKFWEFQVTPNYFDLWAIAEMQLKSCGILSHHIQIAKIDTFDSPQDFFSYRRDKQTGRNGTFAYLLAKN